MKTTLSLNVVRRFALAFTCCALGACTSSDSGGSPTGTGGGTGGTSAGHAGTSGNAGTTGVGGSSTGAAGTSTGAGGSSTGGTVDVTGTAGNGSGTGGTTTGTAGTAGGMGGNDLGTGGGGTGTGGSSAGTGGIGTGTGGAGGGAVGGNGGSGACAGVFCDGFEGSTKLGTAWTVDNSVTANVVEVVSDKAHTGTNSVHMKFGMGSGATFIHETTGFPFMNNSLWGRVWLYVMNDPTSNGHDVYIEASDGMNTTNHGVRPLNTQSGSMSINIDPSTMGGSGETSASSNKPLPRGAWTCFEWQINATGNSGSVTLYMGGTMLANVAKTYIPNLVYQRVGYEHYNADKAGGDMWIDDFAIGTSRLNCN